MIKLESEEILNQMNQRITKGFLDVMILLELRKEAMNGHDITARMRNKFQMTVEPESVNSTLNLLEKNELVKSRQTQEKRIYALTEKGEETVKAVLDLRDRILGLVLNILTG